MTAILLRHIGDVKITSRINRITNQSQLRFKGENATMIQFFILRQYRNDNRLAIIYYLIQKQRALCLYAFYLFSMLQKQQRNFSFQHNTHIRINLKYRKLSVFWFCCSSFFGFSGAKIFHTNQQKLVFMKNEN